MGKKAKLQERIADLELENARLEAVNERLDRELMSLRHTILDYVPPGQSSAVRIYTRAAAGHFHPLALRTSANPDQQASGYFYHPGNGHWSGNAW